MKKVIGWGAVAVVAVAALGIAHQPLFWVRYLASRADSGQMPMSLYEPRELVPGGNEPPAPRETPASESLDGRALEAAADYAATHDSQALIVMRHGYLVFERYWHGTDFNTLVDSQGLGRLVVALVTGRALADRKLGWPDEPVENLFPEWRNDRRGAITVHNLLQLSSGLVPPAPSCSPWSEAAREAYGQDVLASYLRRALDGAPGQRWRDQSADADLLAELIQRSTQTRYSLYVSQALWRRIGAADAWIWLDRPGGMPHADRGFIARQGDWMRVAEVVLTGGRYQGKQVLLPRWVPFLLQPAASRADYGAYVRVGTAAASADSPYAVKDVILASGGGNRLWMIPSLQIAILRTGRTPGDGGRSGGGSSHAMTDWDDSRIPNLIVSGVRDRSPAATQSGIDVSTLVPQH